MNDSDGLVLQELSDGIGTVTLAHEQRRNALSRALIEQLIDALDRFRASHARVVVLRARPGVKVWSAGHDIRELPRSGGDPLAYNDPLERAVRAVRAFPAPVIAMIEGGVWGGAVELVLCCDIPIAAPSATFALTPAKIGVPYNPAGLLRIMSEVDLSTIKEMLFTARSVDASRALRSGLINHIVDADEIERFTYDMARCIARLSSKSIASIKEQLVLLSDARPINPDAFERIQELRRSVYDSADFREGVTAFLEKRQPRWPDS